MNFRPSYPVSFLVSHLPLGCLCPDLSMSTCRMGLSWRFEMWKILGDVPTFLLRSTCKPGFVLLPEHNSCIWDPSTLAQGGRKWGVVGGWNRNSSPLRIDYKSQQRREAENRDKKRTPLFSFSLPPVLSCFNHRKND